MSEEFLACPRCACLKFYSRGDDGSMTFFQVNKDLAPIATSINAESLKNAKFSPIYCTGCSWSGELKDLAPKR